MRKIISVAAAIGFIATFAVPVFAAPAWGQHSAMLASHGTRLSLLELAVPAQPDLKALMGDKTVALKGVFTFVEYDNGANAIITLKVNSVVKEKNRKIKKVFSGKEALLYMLKGTPTVCMEDKGPLEFAMFGYGDKFEMNVKINADGKLQVVKIRSLNFHCNPDLNTFPKPGPERDSGETLYHGMIENLNMQNKTFDLNIGADHIYHVVARKIKKVTMQHSPKSAYFTVMEKISTIKNGDNAHVKGFFNNKTFVITPKSIRISN